MLNPFVLDPSPLPSSPSCCSNPSLSPDVLQLAEVVSRRLCGIPLVSRSISSYSTAVPPLALVSVRGPPPRALLYPLPFALVFPLVSLRTGAQPTVTRGRRCSAPLGATWLGMLRLIFLELPSMDLAGPLRCCSTRTTSAAPAPFASFSRFLPPSTSHLRSLSLLPLLSRWPAQLGCASQ